jgi:tRNA(Ile)-lysidine synthase
MSFSEHALPAALRSLGAVARFCVAYSGGLDSSVLLHALARCRDALGAPLVAVHVDHALLSEAAAWTAHCRATCAELGVPLQVVEVDAARRRAALGVEAAARDARYAALADLLGPGDCLLTAHHRDDQAETVLLQLLRGCGPAGLAAMPGVAPLGRGRLARPLLDVSRADLRAYAVEHLIGFVQDPSNSDPELARGFLRTEVTPRLQARWPGMSRTLARAARHAADAAAIIAERAAEDLERLTASTPWRMPVAALAHLSAPRRRAALRQWCRARGVEPPDTARLDELLQQLATARAGSAIEVRWPGAAFRRYRDTLILSPDLPAHDAGARLPWGGAVPLALPSGLGALRLAPGGTLRRDALAAGAEVCFRAPGLRCAPAGRAGHHDLKHLFQETGVPPWLRDRVPLVFIGGQLAAIADGWICAEFAIPDGAAGLSVVWERPGHLDVWTADTAPPPAGG